MSNYSRHEFLGGTGKVVRQRKLNICELFFGASQVEAEKNLPVNAGNMRGTMGKNLPANARNIRDSNLIPELGSPLEGMKTHSSILAWRIPLTENPGGLQSIESQKFRHD